MGDPGPLIHAVTFHQVTSVIRGQLHLPGPARPARRWEGPGYRHAARVTVSASIGSTTCPDHNSRTPRQGHQPGRYPHPPHGGRARGRPPAGGSGVGSPPQGEHHPTCTCLVPFMRGDISSQVRLPSGPATSGGSSCSLAVVTESPRRPELPVATQAGRSSGSQPISAGALGLLGACGGPKRGAPGRREPGRHPQVDVRHDLEAVIIRRH